MLMRTDPFRELDRLTEQALRTFGTRARPAAMPMDAWRDGDHFVMAFDVPGVDASSLDIDVERNVLTVTVERPAPESGEQMLASERPSGVFSRQLVLGDNLDLDKIEARYDVGVLTLRVPVAEQAKPRKVEVASGRGEDQPLAISA
jgi:HSP20 family protein